jgi:hypothetical protein
MTRSLFCICSSFPPEVTPTAIRSGKILNYLSYQWQIFGITQVQNCDRLLQIQLDFVKSWYPQSLINQLTKLRFEKLLELLIYPDPMIFWLLPALFRARQTTQNSKPDVIVVFMMPYSAGLIGFALKWLIDRPLVINFDDSLTCSDMQRRLYRAWLNWGRYQTVQLDYSSSSPVFIGKAVQQVMTEHPDWKNQLQVKIYGNSFSESLVERVLHNQAISDVVSVFKPLPHAEAIAQACAAGLLFLALPARPDDSRGGRISAKTYEYLMTDRPIFAAVPQGDNWDYLEGLAGVWRIEPTNIAGMAAIISQLAAEKCAGRSPSYNRAELHEALSYKTLAEDFNHVLHGVCAEP